MPKPLSMPSIVEDEQGVIAQLLGNNCSMVMQCQEVRLTPKLCCPTITPSCCGSSKGLRTSMQGFRGYRQVILVLPCGEVQCKDITTANTSRSSSFSSKTKMRLGGL